jgi:hypothetical protein
MWLETSHTMPEHKYLHLLLFGVELFAKKSLKLLVKIIINDYIEHMIVA